MFSNFSLSGYDIFSFDLDNTICQYNLPNLFNSQYEFMTSYLSDKLNYNEIERYLDEERTEFLARGLFIDFQRGTLLKLNNRGVIVRASFGSQFLPEKEITDIYGSSQKMHIIKYILKNPLLIQTDKVTSKAVFITDFTNAATTAVYASAIDVAKNTQKSIPKVWADVMNATLELQGQNGRWVKHFKSNLGKFIFKSDRYVKNWLRGLKERAKTALITSSDVLTANMIAERALGADWKNLFNFVVYSARKPYFFTERSCFYALKNGMVGQKTAFKLEGEFARGSYGEIEKVFYDQTGRRPKWVYFGDSPINDLVAPKEAVSIVEEVGAEKLINWYQRFNKRYLTSKQWGSLFYEGKTPTYFGNIVMKTKFCAPSLGIFVDKPFEYQYQPFWNKK